jgi:uridylate kinase
MPEARYKRVLLKLSGEALSGQNRNGIDNPTLTKIAKQIKRVVGMGVSVAIVVGGGNIWRGAQAERDGTEGLPPTTPVCWPRL